MKSIMKTLFSLKKIYGETIKLVKNYGQIKANNFNFFYCRISKNWLLELLNVFTSMIYMRLKNRLA